MDTEPQTPACQCHGGAKLIPPECICNPTRWAWHIICSRRKHIVQCWWWAHCKPLNKGNISTLPDGSEAKCWADSACVEAGLPSCSLVETTHWITLEKLVVSWKAMDQKAQFYFPGFPCGQKRLVTTHKLATGRTTHLHHMAHSTKESLGLNTLNWVPHKAVW
jgi:hypothetical protein